VIYTFDSAESTREALLELPCIHIAEDSGNLISDEALNYGYYEVEGAALMPLFADWISPMICGTKQKQPLSTMAGVRAGKVTLSQKESKQNQKRKKRAM